MKYYLAVDIGASSGRLILSHREDEKLILEEIHRFENGMEKKNGQLVWNTDRLFVEILNGMKKCKKAGKIPVSIGVDTWAVDFALLNGKEEKLGETVGYRDSRTQGMDEKVYEKIPESALYTISGIQKQPFNTIYQLMALKEKQPELLEEAQSMLMIPDYLHFLLCGEKVTEYTNATTTQLVDPIHRDWNWKLIDLLGYPRRLFKRIALPGERLGSLRVEVAEMVGFSCEVVLPATHDTGAAVMAVPTQSDETLYISSGTWSLMGTELSEANCSCQSRRFNFTNEGGYDYRFRYLKNIMGMWMINSARKELAPNMSFSEICALAEKQTIPSIVDANSDLFLAPESMVNAVQTACAESNQPVPKGIGEVAAVIYNSLAACYAKTAREIEEITGKTYDAIHVIGGGSQAEYLNRLTAKACQKNVLAGPVEATAIGNIVAQMITSGELRNLKDARDCVFRSFEIQEYQG